MKKYIPLLLSTLFALGAACDVPPSTDAATPDAVDATTDATAGATAGADAGVGEDVYAAPAPAATGLRGNYQYLAPPGDAGYLAISNGVGKLAGWGPGPVSYAGLCSARPAPIGSGATYDCTDFPVSYIDNPSTAAWLQRAGNAIVPIPPASWTTVAGSITTPSYYADSFRVANTANTTSSWGAVLNAGTLTSTNIWMVTLTASFQWQAPQTYIEIGPVICNGTTVGTSLCYSLLEYGNTGLIGFQYTIDLLAGAHQSGAVSFGTGFASLGGGDGLIHLRLLNDGLYTHWESSPDGYGWEDHYAQATPSGVAQYGLLIGNESASGSAGWSMANVYQATLIQSASFTFPPCTISAASNTTPIVIVVPSSCKVLPGDLVAVNGVTGNAHANTGTCSGGVCIAATSSAGDYLISTTASADAGTTINVTLLNSAGNGAYTGGGTLTILSR